MADVRYCFPLPAGPRDEELAPLLCAGLIGYRALRAAGDGERHRPVRLRRRGAHRHAGRDPRGTARVRLHPRQVTSEAQSLARGLGAEWAGAVGERPEELDAAIIFAPAGELVPEALAAVGKGGTVVCAGIHMSAIPSFPYELLWGERVVRSVANLTRQDGAELFEAIRAKPVKTVVEVVPALGGRGRARSAAPRRRARRSRAFSSRVSRPPRCSCRRRSRPAPPAPRRAGRRAPGRASRRRSRGRCRGRSAPTRDRRRARRRCRSAARC